MKKSPHEIVQRTRGRDSGDGADQLLGEDGDDKLFGQTGNDVLWGGAGDDLMMGFTGTRRAANDAMFEMRRMG